MKGQVSCINNFRISIEQNPARHAELLFPCICGDRGPFR